MNTVQMTPGWAADQEGEPYVHESRWRRVLQEIVVGYVAVSAVLIGIGMFLTHVIEHSALLAWDVRVIRDLSMHRTAGLIDWSSRWSFMADAPAIVAVGAAVALVCAFRRRWLLVLWIAAVLALELGVFLTVSYTVGRSRPEVAHLGSVPSTGSFPSGHIAATIALYGTIALLVRVVTHNRWARGVAWGWTVTAAALVGWARMYRGMHHPLDVTAGALLGAAICVVGWRAFGQRETDGAITVRDENSHIGSHDSKEHQ